ncbi:protein YgfX [Xenorhabdus mauleonii]|uniref:protein YgfX n=1 Tax=Xenorhabdus mauleonii TaxID=351675 RepID=UPI000ABD2156|nr:protein YgfX [Xenorhabdus mauleonii]
MVLWNNELTISRHTRLFSSCVHGGVALAALLAPWPISDVYFWLPSFVIIILLAVIMMSWIRSQKSIHRCQGRLVLFKDNKVHWQKAAWSINQPPWFCHYGMVVVLDAFGDVDNTGDQPPARLWLAFDSMSPEAWRHLNQLMRQYPDT